MEDAASEISDWEVLSAASGCGGGDDYGEVLVVSGGGGDVLHDHFALAPGPGPDPEPAAACPVAEFPGEGPWSGTGGPWQGLELLDGFDPIPPATFDFAAGGGYEAREGASVFEAAVARGATWSADADGDQAVDAEIEQENNAVIGRGELRLVPQPALHGVGETLDSDTATPAGAASLHSEAPESPPAQLDGPEIDAGAETACLGEDAVSSDGIHGEQEEQEQGSISNGEQEEQEQGSITNASGFDELDGEAKGAASPRAEEGEKQVAVWWRLPFRLLHFCAWKVKPAWSFSIAAALLGLVVLGRRMYRMKRKAKGLPQIKIAFDDKRASQFADRAGRLNEAFLVARRVPLLRTTSGAVLPWSMVQER